MAEVETAKFSCKQCGKSYKWKPEFAGKKVKCKCGYVMTAPAKSPAPPVEEDGPDLDALYTLADEGKQAAAAAPPMIRCPSCQGEMEPGQSVCPGCGFNLKSGKKAKAAASGGASASMPRGGAAVATAGAPSGAAAAFQAFGAPKKRLESMEVKEDKVADLYAPIALIVFGLVLTALQHTHFSKIIFPVPQALGMAACEMVVSVTLLIVLCVFMMRIAEIAFGAPGPALLKVCAIAIIPAGIFSTVSYILNDPFGMVGMCLAFGAIWCMYYYLFDMEQSDIWLLGGLTTVITVGAVLFIAPTIMKTVPGFESLQKGAVSNDDKLVADLDEIGRLKDARPWLDDSNNRIVGDLPREASTELVDDMIALTSDKNVRLVVEHKNSQAMALVLKLPSGKDKRKAVFDKLTAFSAKYKAGAPPADQGQNYLLVRFLYFSDPQL